MRPRHATRVDMVPKISEADICRSLFCFVEDLAEIQYVFVINFQFSAGDECR